MYAVRCEREGVGALIYLAPKVHDAWLSPTGQAYRILHQRGGYLLQRRDGLTWRDLTEVTGPIVDRIAELRGRKLTREERVA